MAARLLRRLLTLLMLGLAVLVGLIACLRFVDPPTSSFILQHRLRAVTTGRSTRLQQDWRPWSRISPHLRLAAVASEDQRFPTHPGIDLDSIRQAARANRSGGAIRGGSTITQQLAKNLFLWPDRSYVRKGLEAGIALTMEALLSKQRILEIYLNLVEFGDGIYGAEAASRHFFGKSAAGLAAREAALLIAVLPNPSVYRVESPGPRTLARQRWILAQMRALGPKYLRTLTPG